MPNPDVVDQPGTSRHVAAEAILDDAAPVTEPALAGTIAGETGSAVAAVDIAAAKTTDKASPAVSSRGAGVAAEPPNTQQSSPAPRALARRQKKGGEAVAGRQLDYSATITPQAISLDGEIKLLRSELTSKLRLQNAQLKTMLERFER